MDGGANTHRLDLVGGGGRRCGESMNFNNLVRTLSYLSDGWGGPEAPKQLVEAMMFHANISVGP